MHTKVCLKNIAKFASLAVAALTLNTASADVILELDLSTVDQVTLRAVTPGPAQTTHNLNWGYGFTLKGTTSTSLATKTLVSSTLGVNGFTPANPALAYKTSGNELNIYASGLGSQLLTAGSQAFSGAVTWNLATSWYNSLLGSATGGDVWGSWDGTVDAAPQIVIGQWRLITPSSSSVPDSSSTLVLLSLSLLGLFAVKRNQLSKAGSVSFSKA